MASQERTSELLTPGYLAIAGKQERNAQEHDARKLRQWATGYRPYEAAVELLTNAADRDRLLPVLTSRDDLIDWIDTIDGLARVQRSQLTRHEKRVAKLVLELAEVSTGEPLSDLLAGVDDMTVAVFLNSAALCAGWGERSVAARVTGTPRHECEGVIR